MRCSTAFTFGCLALYAVAGHAAAAPVMRIASSVTASRVALGASFHLKFTLTPLSDANGPVVIMISFAEPPDRSGAVVETTSISGSGQRLDAPSAYCGEGLLSTAPAGSTPLEHRRCVIAQWPSASAGGELVAVFRVTPQTTGLFHVKTSVRVGSSVDRVPERFRGEEFKVDVLAANGLCVAAAGSICDEPTQVDGQTHVGYISAPGGQPSTGAKTASARAEPFGLSGTSIGVGLGVLNNSWLHIDVFYDNTFLFPFFLWDVTRRAGAQGHSHNGLMGPTAAIETWHSGVGDVMYDFDNVWTGFDQRAGVDAHVHAGMVYDYLLFQLLRNGFDNQGGNVKTKVEYDGECIWIWCWNKSPDNASWDGREVTVGKATSFPSLAGALDVIAHEWGHGITDRVGGLEYQRESGALNEAFSDWLGTAVEWHYGETNWTIGEGVRALRDLSNPRLFGHPDTYQGPDWVPMTLQCGSNNDNCGVHTNSGVPNKMFYLLASPGTKSHNGITVQGIGVQPAMRLAYRANLLYWNQAATFLQARDGMVLAAGTPFEASQVRNAWRAVGVKPATEPVFITPADGSTVTTTILNFQWTPIAGATRYELRVIEANTPQQFRVELLGGSSTSAIYTFPSGNYRAEVRACDNSGCAPPGVSSFIVNGGAVPSSAPSGVSCSVANDNGQNRLNCNWGSLTGAHFYFVNVVQPGSGPGGGALTVAGKQVGTNSVSVLLPNGNATVLVRACTGDGCGPFSQGVVINPVFGNPAVPALGVPFAGSSVDAGASAPNVTFSWNRVGGDNGSNYRYRLYVQDFSRNLPALDVLTTNNFYGAYFNPGTRYDALVIAIPNDGSAQRVGPPSAFLTRGRVPLSPVMTAPTYGSVVSRNAQGQVAVAWTPLVNSDGTVSVRNYQYFFSGPTQFSGVTTATSLSLALQPGNWLAIVRACTTGTGCTANSAAGWGPWNNEPAAEGGMAGFTVQ